MPLRMPRRSSLLLKTGQVTTYHVGDEGSYQRGIGKSYEVLTAGQYAGTTNVDVPSYAGNQIAFAATTPGTITDVAVGLATFKTGDQIVIRGSALNNGVYDVSTGNVAATIRTTQPTVLEVVGPYVSLCKRVALSNNVVRDLNTGLMWLRVTTGGPVLPVGPLSNGGLPWYDVAFTSILHPLAADLQMIAASRTLRIVGGAAEVNRYHIGDVLLIAGFANAGNNLLGHIITSVTVNGADLDIVLKAISLPDGTISNPLTSEAAGGARSITLVCQSQFAYCAAANAASVAGYTDWRIMGLLAAGSLLDGEAPNALPDPVAFPSWPNNVWTSQSFTSSSLQAMYITQSGLLANAVKTSVLPAALVRG